MIWSVKTENLPDWELGCKTVGIRRWSEQISSNDTWGWVVASGDLAAKRLKWESRKDENWSPFQIRKFRNQLKKKLEQVSSIAINWPHFYWSRVSWQLGYIIQFQSLSMSSERKKISSRRILIFPQSRLIGNISGPYPHRNSTTEGYIFF